MAAHERNRSAGTLAARRGKEWQENALDIHARREQSGRTHRIGSSPLRIDVSGLYRIGRTQKRREPGKAHGVDNPQERDSDMNTTSSTSMNGRSKVKLHPSFLEPEPPKRRGRPPGSKNKPKVVADAVPVEQAPVKRGRGKTVLEILPPKKKKERPETVQIFSIQRDVFRCTIFGLSDLIVNNFNEKSVQEMEDQRRLDGEGKRAKKREDRPPVIPEERYQLARVLDHHGVDSVPARYVKAAMITAARRYGEAGLSTTSLLGSLYVRGDLLPIRYTGVKPWPALLPYLSKPIPSQVPFMRRDVCRVGRPGMKQPDLRYRPSYKDWSLDLEIEYEPNLLSLGALHQLIRRAGSSIGLCEWRPEGPGGEKRGGDFGRFDIKAGLKDARKSR